MSLKTCFLALCLLGSTACLATESGDSGSADSGNPTQSQSSTTGQGNGSSDQDAKEADKDGDKKPDMAEYCKEHTC
jgi:hypothetical protein